MTHFTAQIFYQSVYLSERNDPRLLRCPCSDELAEHNYINAPLAGSHEPGWSHDGCIKYPSYV